MKPGAGAGSGGITEPTPTGGRLGAARVLFNAPYRGNPGHWYDISRDGKRFVNQRLNAAAGSWRAAQPCRELDGRTEEMR